MYTDVSDEFLEALNGAEPNYCFKMDFGGDVIVDDVFSVSYSGGSCGDSIVPGGTVISNIKVELSVLPSSVRKGNSCTVYFGINGEYIPCNIFNLTKIEKNGERLNLSFEDNMAKTEKGYFSSLSYPSTTLKMLSEIATKCGVSFDTAGLTAITIKEKPEGYTCREIIGYIAGLYGKFAVCNRAGKIAFKWYDTANPVQLSEYCYDTPTIDTDNTVIGRVVCNGYSSGNGTAIDYDCIFMTQAQLETVYASLNGFTYRTGTLTLRLGNILVDAWDTVNINYGGETIILPAGVITMKYNGGISMEISAPSQKTSADEESYKSPAAKQMERLVAQLLSAEQAIIKKASIEELNASIANLENVYAAKADVEDLTTQVATIESAYIGKADVEQLYAKKAEIDSLVATSASFTTINSKVANINNLLAGNAGTGTLTTIKLTAENAEIATALIKDLTAANFRSKTIETDDFIIKSSSGKLQIVGNTIQIKDINNIVRVQIGEDGKSDYGIYVCDASGKIMFTSYDGLHADGIKSGIIKNDMVADDAHISGSKLDISSIIDGINDDSTYLKSSRVIIDGTEQTINAKFTELTTSIDGIGTRTSTLESDLSGFRTTVSETYATKNDVEGIEVGSRNLLLNTESFSEAASTSLSGALLSGAAGLMSETYRGLSVRGGAVSDSQSVVCRYGFKNFDLGETFTFSFFARGNVSELRVYFYGDTGYVQVAKCVNSQGETNTNVDGRCSFTVSDEWKRYWVRWTLKTTGDTSVAKWILIRSFNSEIGQEIFVCGCKLEKGNKATDWSPAPEDTTAEITSLSSKQSSIEQTVNGFISTVESTYATNESVTQQISVVEQKADKISWLVKSGDSASSMELTSEALKIIANTEIKGDVIIGGTIKSENYVSGSTGMMLSLANGSWDSKYFKVSSTGSITATGGKIGGFTIGTNSLYNGLSTINHTEGQNENTGVNLDIYNGLSIYCDKFGTEIKEGKILLCSLGREIGYIAPISSDFSNYSKIDIGIIAKNKLGTANLYGQINIGYETMADNGIQSAYTVCCDGRKSENEGFNSIFHVKTRFSRGLDASDIYFSYEKKSIGSIGVAGYYGVPGTASNIHTWLPVFTGYMAFQEGIFIDPSNTKPFLCYGNLSLLSATSSMFVVGNSSIKLSLRGSEIFSSQSITVSSDARVKNHIDSLPKGSENLFDYLDGKSFFYNDSVSTQKSYGFIAQDVLSALTSAGLTTDDFAGFCDINGDGTQYALAYEQFIPIMWNEIKRLRKALSERS